MIRKIGLLLFLFSACGLRESRNLSVNVFLGSWELDYISCFASKDSVTELERYEFTTSAEVTMTFSGINFQYTSKGSTCTTSAAGSYSTDFNGTNVGVVDLYNVLNGDATCSESIVDSGTSTVGAQTIPMTLTAPYSSDLYWSYSSASETLSIEYFAKFGGSIESVTCSSNCFCSAVFVKSTN